VVEAGSSDKCLAKVSRVFWLESEMRYVVGVLSYYQVFVDSRGEEEAVVPSLRSLCGRGLM
jgi:hypothetical protein